MSEYMDNSITIIYNILHIYFIKKIYMIQYKQIFEITIKT